MADGNNNKSLAELFSSAKAKQDILDQGHLDPRTGQFQETLQQAVDELTQCSKLVDQAALFSRNEEVEDISTQNLQYLTIPYLLAELLLRSSAYPDHQSRVDKGLKRAATLLDAFLSRLDEYRILTKPEQELFERVHQSNINDITKNGGRGFSITEPAAGPEEKRRVKISRFKEEKELKQKIQYLRTQSKAQADDEVVRNLYRAEIALDVHQAFQSLDMISQELSILAQVQQHRMPTVPRGPVAPTTGQDDKTGYSERLDGPGTLGGLGRKGGPLLDKKGKPLQPFTIVGKRTQMQKGVFRPGHNLPTMSIDEYLEEERRRGGIIEGGGNAGAAQEEPDEDNMEVVDAATMKAREWDDFVEANPKGAGNTLNRG